MTATQWPRKTREWQRWAYDSTRWNGFAFRPDDIVVTTYAKSGTTWMQQIVSQLVFLGDQEALGGTLSAWPDFRLAPDALEKAERQTHRRFLKTHLPLDTLVYSPKAKYIFVGRDGRDVYWSWYNHHVNMKPGVLEFLSSFPEHSGPPYGYPDPDLRRAFLDWLDHDSFPHPPFFDHIRGWWEIRDLPNMLTVHFNDLKRDLEAEARRVAEFLEIEVPAAAWPGILERCSFAWMRDRAVETDPEDHPVFKGGSSSFFHKGSNGRWRDVLTAEDIARYEAIAVERLPPDCAHWLANGRQAVPLG